MYSDLASSVSDLALRLGVLHSIDFWFYSDWKAKFRLRGTAIKPNAERIQRDLCGGEIRRVGMESGEETQCWGWKLLILS